MSATTAASLLLGIAKWAKFPVTELLEGWKIFGLLAVTGMLSGWAVLWRHRRAEPFALALVIVGIIIAVFATDEIKFVSSIANAFAVALTVGVLRVAGIRLVGRA